MKRFSNILFVAESDIDNTRALARTVELADHNQARLTIAGAMDFGRSPVDRSVRDALIADRKDRLTQLAQSVSLRTGSIETRLLVGKAFIEIVREVLLNGRDLVVKTHMSSGLISPGGTDKKLLRKCPCPVWLIRPSQQQAFAQILLALDYEPDNPENEPLNRQLVEMASSLAVSEFAQLHLVHAWRLEHESFLRSARSGLSRADVDRMIAQEEDRRSSWLRQLVDDYCRPLGAEVSEFLQPEFHLIQGRAEEAVPECAARLQAGLIVMGTVGRSGIPGFVIGNTAEAILDRVDCSVLAVKPAGFVSPVTADDTT